jgi:hypothetical protein
VDPPAWPGAVRGAPGLLRVRVRARAGEPASEPEAAKMAQPHGRMIGHRLAHACRRAQRRPTPGELESRTLTGKGPDWKYSESPPASDSGPPRPSRAPARGRARPYPHTGPGPGPGVRARQGGRAGPLPVPHWHIRAGAPVSGSSLRRAQSDSESTYSQASPTFASKRAAATRP